MNGPSPFKQAQYSKFEVRKSQYNVHWKTDLIGAVCADPCFCCISMLCPPCVSFHIRKRVLYNDMTRYTCCNSDCPCSGRLGEQNCPEVCLALEACFCFAQSVASSRWAIQDEQHIQNTACDNCIIATMIAAQYVACLCDIAACITGSGELGMIADVADSIAHFLWVTVCACMQTQAKVQLDERDANPNVVRTNAYNPYQAPQQQAIPPPGMGGVPMQPAANYAPQGGYPPQGYPPQQGGYGGYPQGAPPQPYPPQGYPAQGPGNQQMKR